MKLAAGIIGAVVALAAAAPAAPSSGARIDIPAIGVHRSIGNISDLDSGPAFWPHTGRPGRGTTVAIAGHRTTHGGPFRNLDKLKAGNRILITYGGIRRTYVVRQVYVRPSSDKLMARATPYERLLLTACSQADGSPTSLDYRIIVWAKPQR